MLRRILFEPLLHFLLLGTGLFVLYQLAGPASSGNRKIVVSDATVAMLVQRYESVWMRLPTSTELQALVDTYVREEILYREGVALGLDRDDPVIQRRVLQKLDVLSEETSSLNPPTDAELESYLQANADRYALAPMFSFQQILFDPVRREVNLQADFNKALAKLNADADPSTLGDSSLLPARVESMPLDRVARDYGDEFAAALLMLPIDTWQGPIRSGFGVHAVRIDSKTNGRAASLADVRAAVERDWENDRRIKTRDAYYQHLLKDYEIQIDTDLSARTLQQGSGPKALVGQTAQ